MNDEMYAVVTRGNGGYEMLDYCQVPIPTIRTREVLIKVLAAGINNTEINTRLGWYSSSFVSGTNDTSALVQDKPSQKSDGGWNKSTPFPIIQGTDCCGVVEDVNDERDAHLIGKRILIRPCIRENGFQSLQHCWMASDFDGAFAQYVKIASSEIFPVDSPFSDAELASIPCAYGTAENMLHRAAVTEQDHVLIAGASGGVGSAAVQLARLRGARVTAIAGRDKLEQVKMLGATKVIARDESLRDYLEEKSIDVVVDNVAGDGFAAMLKLLKRGGRYVSSGAISGPIVNFDMRDFYLKDLSLIGCTAWDEPVFSNLVSYLENQRIKPLVAKTFALKDIVSAQVEFLEKKHVGKFVLIPPQI